MAPPGRLEAAVRKRKAGPVDWPAPLPATTDSPRAALGARRVRVDRQVPVHVIPHFGVVVAPAVGPDPRRAQRPLAGAEDDAEGFVVENYGETCHREDRFAFQDTIHQGKTSAIVEFL